MSASFLVPERHAVSTLTGGSRPVVTRVHMDTAILLIQGKLDENRFRL